jgi:hypothetical protein
LLLEPSAKHLEPSVAAHFEHNNPTTTITGTIVGPSLAAGLSQNDEGALTTYQPAIEMSDLNL